MNERIDLSYYAIGNRNFSFLKKNSNLSLPSASVKISSSDLLHRNYLNFEYGALRSFKSRQRNLKKSFSSKSAANLTSDEIYLNKYHPEYKSYKSTKEQISELNNYLNPIKQYLYKDNPPIKTTTRLLPLEKRKRNYYCKDNRYENYEIENGKKIVLKNHRNSSILIPNNYKIKNFNSNYNIKKNDFKASNKTIDEMKLSSFLESEQSPEYLRNYDKESLKNIDNYYINKRENLHVLSRFGNWITLRPDDKNRSHALEKEKHGIYDASVVAPAWMDIASRRKVDNNIESAKKMFKCIQTNDGLREKGKVTLLFDRDQNYARPIFMRDSYEKNRILLNEKNQ